MANSNTDKIRESGEAVLKGGKAVGESIKNFLVGSKDTTKNAAGGALGFLKGAGDAAVSIATGAVKFVSAIAERFPAVTAVVVAAGAFVGIKKWMKNREDKKDLQTMKNANELAELSTANETMQAQMAGKGNFQQQPAGPADGRTATFWRESVGGVRPEHASGR